MVVTECVSPAMMHADDTVSLELVRTCGAWSRMLTSACKHACDDSADLLMFNRCNVYHVHLLLNSVQQCFHGIISHKHRVVRLTGMSVKYLFTNQTIGQIVIQNRWR